MRTLHFEDFPVGTALPEASLAVDPDDARAFVAAFGPGASGPGDPEDEAPPLSGVHVAALVMRLLYDAVLRRTASLGAPGIEAVTWPNPVRPGDVLRFAGRVEAARASASRPGMGLVSVAIAVFNQRNALVMTQRNAIMVKRGNAD